MSAVEIAAGIKTGRFSAQSITEQALNRAKTRGRELNAFITICEDKAFEQSEIVDKKIARGEKVSLLAGVPVALKDNICYTGYAMTCGSHIIEDFNPPYHATCTKKLVDTGVVIIGKTNMDEFGMGSSNENSFFGPVKNPHNHDLVPGGSSGGSAAVVAGGIVPLAFGSETGGSVRQPAAFCGVLGLKPTYGSISRYGLVAFGSSLDQIGPMARNATDLALAFKIVAGFDKKDSTSSSFEHPDYSALIETEKKFKIGIPKEYFSMGLDSGVEKSIRETIKKLEKKGHTFIDISLPLTEKAIATYYIIASAEASSNLARYDGVRYGLREGRNKKLIDMYGQTRTTGFGDEVKRRIMLGTYVLSAGYHEAYYIKATKVREMIRQDFVRAFEKADFLISPTTPTTAFRLGEKIDDPLAMYLSDIYTAPVNLAGIPAISVPCGYDAEGRPVGVQFMASHFGELSLFQIARIMERLA